MSIQDQWMNTDQRLLKASDIARILNISRAMAYRLMSSGDIPVVRMNNSVRVRPEDMDAYIQQCWSGWKS